MHSFSQDFEIAGVIAIVAMFVCAAKGRFFIAVLALVFCSLAPLAALSSGFYNYGVMASAILAAGFVAIAAQTPRVSRDDELRRFSLRRRRIRRARSLDED